MKLRTGGAIEFDYGDGNNSARRTVAVILVCVLTVFGSLSLYQTLFDLWMTAYPYANTGVWASKLYLRLATTIIVGILWVALVLWLLKQRRNKPSI